MLIKKFLATAAIQAQRFQIPEFFSLEPKLETKNESLINFNISESNQLFINETLSDQNKFTKINEYNPRYQSYFLDYFYNFS